MLRCLAAHPRIHVVHQVREPDQPEDLELYRHLMGFAPTEIAHDDPFIQAAGVKEGQILVLKNAVWTHPHPFQGFVLARNSLSVANSFKIQGETEIKFQKRKRQFERWMREIDPTLLPSMSDPDNFACLAILYNRKMTPLAGAGLPIVRYEDFVSDPEGILRRLLERLRIPWDDVILNSHEQYVEGEYGHGHIPLWKPIHQGALDRFKQLPDVILAKVYGLTWGAMHAFGYVYENEELRLRDDVPNLVKAGGATCAEIANPASNTR